MCLVSAQTAAIEERFYRDGNGALEYVCTADARVAQAVYSTTASESSQPYTTVAVANLTSIAVAGTTATATFSQPHSYGVNIRVTVAGATVDPDLNGTYTVTSVTSTTIVFTVANVTAATYTEAGLKIQSTAPKGNSAYWTIEKMYNTSTSIDRHTWIWGDGSRKFACDSRTTY